MNENWQARTRKTRREGYDSDSSDKQRNDNERYGGVAARVRAAKLEPNDRVATGRDGDM